MTLGHPDCVEVGVFRNQGVGAGGLAGLQPPTQKRNLKKKIQIL